MKRFKQVVVIPISIIIVIMMIGGVITAANHYGAKDRSFQVYDYKLKENVHVTESTIREKFEIAPNSDNCDLMGICNQNGKTVLDPKRWSK